MNSRSSSPPAKRVKLETEQADPSEVQEAQAATVEDITVEEEEEAQCSICLQPIVDLTILPTCSHEFCFECIRVWSEQSRRCPLCTRTIGDYVIHDIRSKYDFRKHYLPPLRTSPPPSSSRRLREETLRSRRTARVREREQRLREEREESNRLDQSVARRKRIYEHRLYAKHVGANAYTRYRPFPTPAQFAASVDYIKRTTTFLRRELQVWNDLDVEFLTTFIISMMKSIDIRSESAIKLLSEFLDLDTPYTEGERHPKAEHFAHEVYTYLRSPFRDLFVYDEAVQYDAPAASASPALRRGERWSENSRSYSRSPPPSPGPSGSSQARGRDPAPASPSPLERSPREISLFESRPARPDTPHASRRRTSASLPVHRPGREDGPLVGRSTTDANSAGSLGRYHAARGYTCGPPIYCRPHNEEVDERHQQIEKGIGGLKESLPSASPQPIPIRKRDEYSIAKHDATPVKENRLPLNVSQDDLPNPSRSPRLKKPPRARNLIQSVQAHLGSGLGSRAGNLGGIDTPQSPVVNSQHGVTALRSSSPPPSLLARLSDPGPEHSNVNLFQHEDVLSHRTLASTAETSGSSSHSNDLPAVFPSSSSSLQDPWNNPIAKRSQGLSPTPIAQNLTTITTPIANLSSGHLHTADGRTSLTFGDVPLSQSRSEPSNLDANHNHEAEDPHGHVGRKLWGNSIGSSSSTAINSEREAQDNDKRARLLAKLLREKRQRATNVTLSADGQNTWSRIEPSMQSTVDLASDSDLLTDSVKRRYAINSTSSAVGVVPSSIANSRHLESQLGKRVRLKAKLAMEKRSLEQ